jgi:hypothetical protein
MMDIAEFTDDSDLDEEVDASDKKKKKRKRYLDVVYDPDQDVTVYRKRRKRDTKDWEDDWDL